MKKLLFTSICLLGLSIGVNAQLKVNSNGNISIQSTATPLSPLSINCSGHDDYGAAICGNKSGLYCYGYGENTSFKVYGGEFYSVIGNTHHCVGIQGVAGNKDASGQNNRIHMGVIGIGGGGKRNIGLFGQIAGTGKGASVYGTTYTLDSGSTLESESQVFAGYFRGDVKVTGDLQVNGSIQGVLLAESPSNNNTYQEKTMECTDILNGFSGLSTSTYKAFKPVIEKIKDDFYEDGEKVASFSNEDREQNLIENQYYDKNHYALYADELEQIYPDLVYLKEDGSKGINYIEMIPLLVQCINELNTKLNKYENNTDLEKSRSVQTSTIKRNVVETSFLYQNTPNPFSERTEIRFSLPDDAQNAYIYIFDMSGKMLRQIPVDSSMQSVTINGYELSAGIYLYSLAVNGQEIDTKRMILSK